MMAALNPFCMAMVKKAVLTFSRWGSPKEMLDTPREVYSPSLSRTSSKAFRVTAAAFFLFGADGHSQYVYNDILFLNAVGSSGIHDFFGNGQPAFCCGGNPTSSMVKAITVPPYFLSEEKYCAWIPVYHLPN